MNMSKFYEAITPVFMRLKYPVIEFEYNKTTGEYISQEPYIIDNIPYIILVKPNGMVVYGITDGVHFYEEDVLDYINLN